MYYCYAVAVMIESTIRGQRRRLDAAPEASSASPYLKDASAFAEVDGMAVHFTSEGSGLPLLLLHGSGASLHIFDAMTARLTARFEVIRLDLPGFGLTGPRPDRDYSMVAYTEFLHHFVEQEIGERFVLAGHSLGGQIAWNYAIDHPERLAGLILMNATGYPEKSIPLALRLARSPAIRPVLRRVGSRSATKRMLSAVVPAGSDVVDDAMVDRVFELTSMPGNRGALVDFAATKQVDRSSEIPRIATPTLILTSDLVDGQRFSKDLRDCSEVELKGVGHLMPAESPSLSSDAIIDFATERGMSERR